MPLYTAKSIWSVSQLNDKRIPHENQIVKGYSAGSRIIIPQTSSRDFSVSVPVHTSTLELADGFLPLPKQVSIAKREFLKQFNNEEYIDQLSILDELIEMMNQDAYSIRQQVMLCDYDDLKAISIYLEVLARCGYYKKPSDIRKIRNTGKNIIDAINHNKVNSRR